MDRSQVLKQIADLLEMQAQLNSELSKLVRALSSEVKEEEKKYYSVREASKLLSVSESTIRKLCADGILEHVRLQGKILIPVVALETLRRKSKTFSGC